MLKQTGFQTMSLSLIVGPMCSGKTTLLHQKLVKLSYTGKKIVCVNHSSDTRSDTVMSTHNPLFKNKSVKIDYISTTHLSDIEAELLKYDIIGIDESQFYPDLKKCVTDLTEKHNKIVICAGLTNNFKREKMGEILDLEPLCDKIKKLYAFCGNCSERAPFTWKHKGNHSNEVEIGGVDKYIPLCRKCYTNH